MRIQVRQIMSLKQHNASCHMLILNQKMHILLDCGLSPTFDFTQYRIHENTLRKTSIILLSQSTLQYIGALPFLVEEFNLKASIYATQPIIILGPINIHQAILRLGSKYSPDQFRKISNVFETINVVKPLQKRLFEDDREVSYKGQQDSNRVVRLMCYPSGSMVGSVCWFISQAMFNCLYLVNYNNYSQYHIDGMDLQPIRSRKIDMVITDTYPQTYRASPGNARRDIYKSEIEKMVVSTMRSLDGRRLVLSCYPNQRLVELLSIFKQLHTDKVLNTRVDLVHCSSSYLALIKSQSEYLTLKLDDDDYDPQEKQQLIKNNTSIFDNTNGNRLSSRICITTAACTQPGGTLWPQLFRQMPQSMLVDIGKHTFSPSPTNKQISLEDEFPNFTAPTNVPNSATKLDREQQTTSLPATIATQQQPFEEEEQQQNIQDSFYINRFVFPKFLNHKPENQDYDAYGLRFQTEQQAQLFPALKVQPSLVHKQSKRHKPTPINPENMHISFAPPPPVDSNAAFRMRRVAYDCHQHLSTFESSVQILKLLKPSKIIFVNTIQAHLDDYEMALQAQANKSLVYGKNLAARNGYSPNPKTQIFGLLFKKNLVFQNDYQTLQMPLVYFGNNTIDLSSGKMLSVQGVVVKSGGRVELRLYGSDERQLTDFNVSHFYQTLRGKHACVFHENGTLEIGPIKLYRRDNEIIMEGMYSPAYFEIRSELYQYIDSL